MPLPEALRSSIGNEEPLAVQTRDLRKSYSNSVSSLLRSKILNHEIDGFDALKGIDIDIPIGSCFGILGLNGSGKSTFLQLLAGIIEPSAGTVSTSGEMAAIFELGSGFNPDFTGRENIAFYARLIGVSTANFKECEEAIVQFAEIGDFIDRPLSTYSTGMVARLGFAARAFLDFDILILDEVLSVGDAYFQRKCFRLLEVLRNSGKTIIFVSHSVNQVLEICDRAMLLHDGELLLSGEPKDCAYAYFEIVNRKHAKWNDDGDLSGVKTTSQTNYGEGGCVLLKCESIGRSFENGFLFKPFENIVLSFRIRAEMNLSELEFGLNFRSISGAIISGRRIEIGDVSKGESVDVITRFNCTLNPGNYFLSCGLTSNRSGKRTFEARHLDFRQIVVTDDNLPISDARHTGLVALISQVEVNRLS